MFPALKFRRTALGQTGVENNPVHNLSTREAQMPVINNTPKTTLE
jgi:hypothetical protein